MTPMRRPAGFVLVLVLAMLVVLGLLAGGIAAVTGASLRRRRSARKACRTQWTSPARAP